MSQSAPNVSAAGNRERNAFVVNRLTEELVALLRDQPLAQVSISELCGRAQVGRASFYRNFESKEDVLRRQVDAILDEWEASTGGVAGDDVGGTVGSLLRCLDGHRAFLEVLRERELIGLVRDGLLHRLGAVEELPAAAAYAVAFAAYSLYGWADVWLRRGMRETPEEVEALFRAQGL